MRRITYKDAQDFYKLRTDPASMQFIGRKMPASLLDIISLIDTIEEGIACNKSITWGIYLKEGEQMAGTIGFHLIHTQHSRAEIGYMLISGQWRRSLMTEALAPVIRYGFQHMHLHSMEAKVDPRNEASIACLTKFGFRQEAYFKENFYFDGVFHDTSVYSLITPDHSTD